MLAKSIGMKNLLSIIVVIAVVFNAARSQSVAPFTAGGPQINQLCPEFSFDTLFNYKNEKLSLAELKGKFVIVDFWGTFCLPCIAAFPKLEKWQKQFGDSLQILLVATDGYQKTKQFYETRKKANKPMFLPCAINRSMARYFQIKQVSTYVWIDDKGYIRAITDESQLTEKNITDFINRKEIAVREKAKRINIDIKKPLVEVAKEIDSNSVFFGSVLTGHLKGVASMTYMPRKGIKVNRMVSYNTGIRNLYQYAYGDSTGFVPSARTVIESAHPEKLTQPKGESFETWKVDNAYCYEINVPEAKCDSIWKMMRDDLQQLFGYNAYLEYRTQQCLILKADTGFRYLADTTVAPVVSISVGGITMINQPFSRVADIISHFLPGKIFFDETGLHGKVAITIKAQMNDAEAVNEELKKYGLRFQYEDRPVQMLVIKDPR
jgi:thiol-disulfide isomerase/thioredoxin